MGCHGKGNASCSAVCLPNHNTSFTTGLCLKPVTSGGAKTSQRLTASAAIFQERVLPSPQVSSANALACGDHTTLSCKVHPWLSLYKGMKGRACDVVLVLVQKCIGLDVIPVLRASPGGG